MNCVFKIVKKNGDVEWKQERNIENPILRQNNIVAEKDIEACIIFVLYDEYENIEIKRKRLATKLGRIKYEIERMENE